MPNSRFIKSLICTSTFAVLLAVPTIALAEDSKLLWTHPDGPAELGRTEAIQISIPENLQEKQTRRILEIEAFVSYPSFSGWIAALNVKVDGWELQQAADRGENIDLQSSTIPSRWTGGWAVPVGPSVEDLELYSGPYSVAEDAFKPTTIRFLIDPFVREIEISNQSPELPTIDPLLRIESIRLLEASETE